MPFEYSKIIPADQMPMAAKNRQIRFRHPWDTIKPGEGFEFGPTVKIMSARVMCANNGTQLGRVFRCYRGTDQKLYALRVDGMQTELPRAPDFEDAPRITAAQAPVAAEVYGDFGAQRGAPMPDNMLNIVDPPPAGPPTTAKDWLPIRVKSVSELKTEQILRDRAQALADKGEDDPI